MPTCIWTVAFTKQWGVRYSAIAAWQKNRARFTLLFDQPLAIRKVVYTTNAIESLNLQLAQGDQGPRCVSPRRRHSQVALSGITQRRQEMDHANPRLKSGTQPVHLPVRRQGACLT